MMCLDVSILSLDEKLVDGLSGSVLTLKNTHQFKLANELLQLLSRWLEWIFSVQGLFVLYMHEPVWHEPFSLQIIPIEIKKNLT